MKLPIIATPEELFFKPMEQDHIISEIRKNREQLSGRFNNDLDKLFEHLKKEQKKLKTKVKNSQARKKAGSAQ